MLTKTIKNTGYAILAAATLSIGSAGLSTSAQAAPININPIPLEVTQDVTLVKFHGGGRGFRGHRGGFKGHKRSFHKGHHYKKKHYYKSRKFSRHHGHGFKKFHHGGFGFKF